MNTQLAQPGVPDYVRPEQVIDFDIYTEPRLVANPHRGYKTLHSTAPDIFYTPRNGGHWVVTRFDQMTAILRDPEHFSNKELVIPKSNSSNVMLPLNLDPPEHAVYRAVLMRHFDKKWVTSMEVKLHTWAGRLIDRVVADGRCDFTEALGAGFPVSIFMELMGMPLERFEEFRGIMHELFGKTTTARYVELQSQIIGIITDLVEARRLEPQDDLVSKLLRETVHGRPLTLAELQSIGFLLFLAGLDTVANALTFSFHHLAGDEALQKRLAAEPERIADFVEESLRCYGVVHQTRIVKKDIEIAGAHFHEGDMVSCALPLAGLDERKNPDPERFDIDRKNRQHIVFSTGAHTCIGNILARAEMRVFTQEWLKRVPRFRLSATKPVVWRAGQVMSCQHLPLEW
jgi:cytochrome P450